MIVVGGTAVLMPIEGRTLEVPSTTGSIEIEPMAGGVLNVTWENMAPETNTYQGDVNLTMLWLALKAEGASITLESIKVDTFGIPSQGINRTFIWDDRNGNKLMNYPECEIAEDISSPYILPPSGQMLECTGPTIGQPVVIGNNTTRYFIIHMDLDFDPTQRFTDRDLRLCVRTALDINSDANTTVGDFPACSRTIDVNRRLFYDDMEHGKGDWTFSGGDSGGMHPNGLWHLSTGEEDCNLGHRPFYHTGNTSWWYGHRYDWYGTWICDYYTHEPLNNFSSTRNWGKLRTPWIDATTGSSLAMTVFHLLARETDSGHDLAQVYLNDGSGWHFVSNEFGTSSFWRKLTLNLTHYAGKKVQLEFRWDTVDERNNNFMGWFIDDMFVYGEFLSHDIAVTDLDVGDYVPLAVQTVSVRVSNIGLSGENGINVKLKQDGVDVNQRTISSLASGGNTTATLDWTPPGVGNYEICVQASPVVGETVLWNNYRCKMVNVTAQNFTKIAVLRSYGTVGSGPISTWDHLNSYWGNYGGSPILIDYTTLHTYPITYEAINDTQADVLVLSGSGYYFGPPSGTELDDSETTAIEKWVREGHGFVAIGTAFNQMVPNNNDLVDLVGIEDQPYDKVDVWDIQQESGCLGHPIFNNVPNLFSIGFNRTMTPNDDHSWDPDDLTLGQLCALSPGSSAAAIVVHKGLVMLSISADVTPTTEELQVLYNSFVWSRYQANDYDVKVSDLIAPRFVRPSYTASISSVASNIGKQDLGIVQVDLKVDGVPVDTQNLSNLLHGDWSYVNFSWVPSSVGVYQICVFADIIGFVDDDSSNNEECMSIEVTNNPPVLVYVLDSWGTDFGAQAPWDNLTSNWNLYGGTPVEVDYQRFNRESITYQELVDSYADVLVISSSRSGNWNNPIGAGYYFSDREIDDIIRYVQEGHGIIATGITFDSDKMPNHGFRLGPLFGMSSSNLYIYTDGINDHRILDPTKNHPLFNKITDTYITANGRTLTPGLNLTQAENWTASHLAGGEYKAMSIQTGYGSVIAYELGAYKAVYFTNFLEKSSNTNDKQLLYNAMVWGRTSIDSPTNLWIYKDGNTLRLEWNLATSPNVQGYRIYRATHVNGFDFSTAYATIDKTTSQWTDPDPNVGIDVNSYFYLMRAFDGKGNEEQNLNKVGKFAQQLRKGSNEISIGFELVDSTTSVAFESVAGQYKRIEAYDPHLCVWETWTPAGGTLTQIERWMGLKVAMRSDGLLINVGRVVFTSIEITHELACKNWNFVGYTSFQDSPLPGALDNQGLAGKYDLVLWFDVSDKKQRWKWFDPNDPGGSPLRELRPGMGIWIHATQPGFWNLNGD